MKRRTMHKQIRVCRSCGELKLLQDFHSEKSSKLGFAHNCKSCSNRADRLLQRQKRSVRKKTPEDAEKKKRWNAKNPAARGAYREFRAALRAGIITPQPCLFCGGKGRAFHVDYDRPLDAEWICAKCSTLIRSLFPEVQIKSRGLDNDG